jgi:GNAT superfamily N-acetyltransferase
MDRDKLIAALAGTWPVRAVKSGLAALQLPGDVYQGNVSMWGEDGRTNPEVVGRSADLAGMLMSGAGAVPAEANTLRSGMSFFDKVAEKYPGVKIDGGVDKSGYATLSRIEVPKDLRNQGLGSQVMKDLLAEADATGVTMALSPSSDFGGNKSRLTEFYKRFGFVPNSGRNKDFSAPRETMIRPLKK